uniref:Uncharacterized protein LOC105852330 n=1 Tax=Cicer arietinum TaxID=3827 RepID=A0A1S3EBR4_CICAR|nr:uncharacterized protein LOC105852330 [Cicer arietinum]
MEPNKKPIIHSSSYTEIFEELNHSNIKSFDFESSDEELDEKIKEEENDKKISTLDEKWEWNSNGSKGLNEFPPPISCIGKSGKPSVSFKCYRNNERIVLKEIPTQDFLHASRDNGRLTLHFVQHDAQEEEEEDCDGGVESNNVEEEEKSE